MHASVGEFPGAGIVFKNVFFLNFFYTWCEALSLDGSDAKSRSDSFTVQLATKILKTVAKSSILL